MSYITANVPSDQLMNFIKTNAAGSIRGTVGDSWRAYLVAQGATGQTLYDLEASYLVAQPGKTLHDKWAAFNSAQGGSTGKEKARTRYK